MLAEASLLAGLSHAEIADAETGLTLAKRLALHLHAQLRRLELCRPDAGRPGRADRNGDER